MRFADYFFDGLFADWAVMDKIGQAKNQVQSTLSQIENVLLRLDDMLSSAQREQAQAQTGLNTVVTQAQLQFLQNIVQYIQSCQLTKPDPADRQ